MFAMNHSALFELTQRATHDLSRRARGGGHIRLSEPIQISHIASLQHELTNALDPMAKREILDELG